MCYGGRIMDGILCNEDNRQVLWFGNERKASMLLLLVYSYLFCKLLHFRGLFTLGNRPALNTIMSEGFQIHALVAEPLCS